MNIIPERSHFVDISDENVQDFIEDYAPEQWKDYVEHYITDDNGFWEEELRNEEQCLYENGYISANELYFGKITHGEYEV